MSKQKIRDWLENNRPKLADDRIIDLIHQYTQDHSGWVSVDGYEELPKGNWLVMVEGKKVPMVAENESKTCIVGGYFAWDREKVIAYTPLPPAEGC